MGKSETRRGNASWPQVGCTPQDDDDDYHINFGYYITWLAWEHACASIYSTITSGQDSGVRGTL